MTRTYQNEKTYTIQLPISIHKDIQILADKTAKELNIGSMSKVAYIRRLIAGEMDKLV